MDDLLKELISSGIGRFQDMICFNHVYYADDVCLMVSGVIALQKNMSFGSHCTWTEYSWQITELFQFSIL